MKRKKILHLITSLEVGGTEIMLLKTLPGLQQKFENRVCCLMSPGEIGNRLVSAGIQVDYLNISGWKDITKVFKLVNIVKTFQPDILTTYLLHADLIGRIIGKLTGIKTIICSVRAWIRDPKYWPLLFLEHLTSPLVNHYLFNAHSVADLYQHKLLLPQSKITIIPNGVDFKLFVSTNNPISAKKRLGLPLKGKVIGFFGTFRDQKGLKYLIDAFAGLAIPDIYLLLAGYGPSEKALKDQVQKLGLTNKVYFTGEFKDIHLLLPAIDIFVLPSLYEGMSNSLLEAMVSGRPVITTNIPENRELISDPENGLLVSTKDSFAIAKAIHTLISNPKLTTSQSRNNILKVRSTYDLSVINDRFLKFYENF
jgi:glycosyltransferase involved in cell wall biosynthesis